MPAELTVRSGVHRQSALCLSFLALLPLLPVSLLSSESGMRAGALDVGYRARTFASFTWIGVYEVRESETNMRIHLYLV